MPPISEVGPFFFENVPPKEEVPQEIIQIRTKKSFADKITKVKDFLLSKRNNIDDIQLGLNTGGKVSLKHHNVAPFGDLKLFLNKAKIYATGHSKQQNLSQLETALKKAETEMRTAFANIERVKKNGATVSHSDLSNALALNAKVAEKKAALERAQSEASDRKGMKKNEEIKEILRQFIDLLNRNSSETEIFITEFSFICGIQAGVKKESSGVKTQVVKSVPVVASVATPVVAPVVDAPVKRSVFRGAKF